MSDDQKEAAPIDAAKDSAQPPAEKPKRTVLETAVMVSPAAAAVLTAIMTLIVAVIAATVQRSITDQTVSKDYVALSIEILKREPKIGPDPLRDYAIALLAAKSPVTISDDAKAQLRSYRLDLGPVRAAEMIGAKASATAIVAPEGARPSTTP